MHIRPYAASDLDAVARLSLRAWEPVFASIERAMDAAVYRELRPDWRIDRQNAVAAVCADAEARVWVAVTQETLAGFVAIKRHSDCLAEIQMIAVDPDFQRRGIATSLTEFAIAWMSDQGISVAMVETGGDPGHAAARRTYEACGFRQLPIARYFKKLEPIAPKTATSNRETAAAPLPNATEPPGARAEPPHSKPEMTADSVLQILDAIHAAGVEACLDGGWGVDALLGEQTRPHADFDLIVSLEEIPQLVPALTAIGFTVQPGWTATNFVLCDAHEREVDVHAIRFDERNYGVFELPDGRTWPFPLSAFAGEGTINDRKVRCLTAQAQVECHGQGYAPKEKDVSDMERLQARFDLVLPLHLSR